VYDSVGSAHPPAVEQVYLVAPQSWEPVDDDRVM